MLSTKAAQNTLQKLVSIQSVRKMATDSCSDDFKATFKDEKKAKSKANQRVITWNKKKPFTQLEKFKRAMEEKYKKKFDSYWDLHEWSVTDFPNFWKEIWHYVGMITSKQFDEVFVKTGPGFLDNDWFTGATLNYAENILRIKDDREAIVYLDEEGILERVTFAQLYEEVKLYAAAFRKNGLQAGDRVACYMGNRKEAVYTMLAITSIGAIWGGPQPFFGARTAAQIISKMEAKFLITEDRHFGNGKVFQTLKNLPLIVERTSSLQKVILVVTKEETLSQDLSKMPCICFLQDFLQTGRTPDGDVPELIFEQLPSDHPVSISFSSGTTGLPKGPVHSAASLIGPLMYLTLHWDLKSGDTLHSMIPNGWTLWNFSVTCLSLGIRLFLQSGFFFKDDEYNIWDLVADYDISFLFLTTAHVDAMGKKNFRPKFNSNFRHLKAIAVGGSPVKIQNYKYLQSVVSEDVFIGSLYGSTETFAPFSGCDYNLPVYAPEIQVPTLGKDLRCYGENGLLEDGQSGHLVIATPCPTLPLRLWKDKDGTILNNAYFSRFPRVWCHEDFCCFNPVTRGFIIKGRSDDLIIQHGECFGPNDIYFAIHDIEEIQDYICVNQTRWDGDSRAVLFVKMKSGHTFCPPIRDKIIKNIEEELWEDYVPALILEIKDIPYTNTNKRLENVVRKILETNSVPKVSSIKNPDCLEDFCNIPEIVNYNMDVDQ